MSRSMALVALALALGLVMGLPCVAAAQSTPPPPAGPDAEDTIIILGDAARLKAVFVLLDTAPDAGCTFAILVPLEHAQAHGRQPGEAVDIASYEASAPSTVLVVDDERAVASFVGELLELHGYHAVVETDPSGFTSTTPNDQRVVVTAASSIRVAFGDAASPPIYLPLVVKKQLAR